MPQKTGVSLVTLSGIELPMQKATHNVPCTYLLCPGIKSNVEVRGKSLPLAELILALGILQEGLYNVRIAFQTCHMEGIQTTLGGEKTCISSCDLGKRIGCIVSCTKTPLAIPTGIPVSDFPWIISSLTNKYLAGVNCIVHLKILW